MTRGGFDDYFRESELMKSLDKNGDGMVSATELTSRAELAFKVPVNVWISSNLNADLFAESG